MNPPVQLHLVAGFLGSGKTTAIVNACKLLAAQGRRTGVVTNDQGKYLVDTAFFRLEDLPAVEVGGGCFCCNYDHLEQQLNHLIEKFNPEVIFAESVGSCADLVATVVRPMLELQNSPLKPASFSVFADARLLRLYLEGQPLPFSEQVVYIFEKQIEEAGLLILNKIDLLTPEQAEHLTALAQARWPEKTMRRQVSLTPDGVQGWVDVIGQGIPACSVEPLEIDYQRYGAGEQRLAWLDQEVIIDARGGDLTHTARTVISSVLDAIAGRGARVGHLKFIVRGSTAGAGKVSITAPVSGAEPVEIAELTGDRLSLLINARVELPAGELEALVMQALNSAAGPGAWTSVDLQAFHPGFPSPTHRL
jgi:Ni2+-binding GTPase involved in maturation of urease and hydrogenase